MTITNEQSEVVFQGNGSATEFPFTFLIPQGSEQVLMSTPEVGEFELTPPEYSITGLGNADGGQVVLPLPLPLGSTLAIRRNLPLTQETDIGNQQKFFASVVTGALDRIVMLVQQIADRARRSVEVPIGQDPVGFSQRLLDAEINATASATAAAGSAALAEQAAESAARPLPLGTTVLFVDDQVPSGWVEADGSSLSRDEWPELYVKLGTMFGEGAGPAPDDIKSNPDFTTDASGWSLLGVSWSADNEGSLVNTGATGFVVGQFSELPNVIIEITVLGVGGTLLLGWGPADQTVEPHIFIDDPGTYRYFVPEPTGRIVLLSPSGSAFIVSSFSVRVGGTFAAPTLTAPTDFVYGMKGTT